MNSIFTEHYNFIPRFYRLAIVNILSNLTIPLAGLISIAFLGHLNTVDSLAGVSLANIIFNLLYLTLAFLRMATTGLTAQSVGADDRQTMLLVGLRNGLIALTLGLCLIIFQYPIKEIGFFLFNADLSVKDSGLAYFDARIWGAPAALLNFVLIGWFLGREKSNQVLVLSVVGNAANIILDYVFIWQYDWKSTGAGMSQACSQYLMFLTGLALIWGSKEIQWQEVKTAMSNLFDWSAFKATITFNKDILIRTGAELSVFTVFGNLSATMGTIIFIQNSLLGQITHLIVYLTDGFGFATETLAGNFKGKESKDELVPLLRVAVASSLFIVLIVSIICVLFPQTIFGILTNHTEVIKDINTYTFWLIFSVVFASASTMLEGFFLGLAEAKIVRNTSLLAMVFGFIPSIIAAWYFHNNHILWLSITLFLFAKMTVLLIYLAKFFSDFTEKLNSQPLQG